MSSAASVRLRVRTFSVLIAVILVMGGLIPASVAARSQPVRAPAETSSSAPDTTPPSVPAGVAAQAIQSDLVEVRWNPSTDNTKVTRYTVARNGTNLAIVDGSARSYVDRSTAPSTAYTYTVRASDAAGNQSAASANAAVTTGTCTCSTATARPTSDVSNVGFTPNAGTTRYTQLDETASDGDTTYIKGPASGTANAVMGVGPVPAGTILGLTVRWTARNFVSSGQPGTMNAHVELLNGSTLIGAGAIRNLGTSYATYTEAFNVNLTSPNLRVKVVQDTAGTSKKTSRFTWVQVTISYRATDTTAPSVPANLQSDIECGNELRLVWNAATDAAGAQGYRLYRGGTQIATLPIGATAPRKLFDFQTGSQGFVASGRAGGSASGGGLFGAFDGPGTWDQLWTWTGTWQQLGVPSGASVTGVQLTRFNISAQIQVTSEAELTVGQVSVADGSGGLYGYLYGGRYFSNGVYGVEDVGPQSPVGLSAAAGDTVKLYISSGVSAFDVYSNWTLDNLELRLTWTGGSGSKVRITDTGLALDTEYRYRVAAFDAVGNTSAQSAEFVARTTTAVATPGDTDCDGIPDEIEDRLGTGDGDEDSDDDGLLDAWEFYEAFLAHEPALADTDGDGTADGLEDFDGDTFNALTEQLRGTDPLEADPDLDELTDPQEILTHGTNPNLFDTDGDGLGDGAEIRAGTNPLDSDSDNDGTPDGQSELTVTVSDPSGVEVAVTGTGDLAGSLTIADVSNLPVVGSSTAQVGPAYDFRLDDSVAAGLTSAEISLPFDPGDPTIGDPNDLAVFTLNENTGVWFPVPGAQVIDLQSGTVTATVDHFSIYALFNLAQWVAFWSAINCENPEEPAGRVDVALIIDSSGSMTSNDPDNLRRTAAKSFVDLLEPPAEGFIGDRAAVVDFDSFSILRQAMTTDKVALKAAIDLIDSSGGTNLAVGMDTGLDELTRFAPDPELQRVAIMLTDGEGFYDHALTDRAIAEDVIVFTVGLGTFVDEFLLRDIAESTGGQYFPVASAEELEEVFQNIGGQIGDDRDNDGLEDCEEVDGLVDGRGVTYTSDPQDKDTDDDGLLDGEEMYVFTEIIPGGGGPMRTNVIESDPRVVDTDGDQLDDNDEDELGTTARMADSDFDGLPDSEIYDGTDPIDGDTDDDNFGDGHEVANADKGFDPLFYDPPHTGAGWADDFKAGMIGGDADERDTVAWMLGSITSGFLVYGDVRDALVNLVELDFVGALFAGVGIIPVFGDGAKVITSIGEFIGRHADKADELFAFIAKSDIIPREVKIQVLRHFRGAAFNTLSGKGISEDNILKLARGRAGLDAVARNLTRIPASNVRSAGRFFPGSRTGGDQAEAFLRGVLGGAEDNTGILSSLGRRFPDHRTFPNGQLLPSLHEVKTGLAKNITRLRRQADKDAAMVAEGLAQDATWHFMASEFSSSIGLDDAFFDYITSKGINIVIWTP